MATDAHTTVGALRQAVAEFVDARDWRPFHTPKTLSMSIAIEAAELMEHFQWLANEEAQVAAHRPDETAAIADELADILIYCLSLSNALDLDVSSTVLDKVQTNEHRYPADEFRRPERKGDGLGEK